MSDLCEFEIPIRTSNPNNGSQGITMRGRIVRAKEHAEQRRIVRLVLGQARHKLRPFLDGGGLTVLLTRVAPSSGLDPDDNLPASLKWVKDGVTDALGLASDRDPRISWRFGQERAKTYAVKVLVSVRKAE